MVAAYTRRCVTADRDKRLPLYLETIGYAAQAAIHREQGYHCFHWLQTIDGAGDFVVNGNTFRLTADQGILLMPNVSHTYTPVGSQWSTLYLTFDGSLAQSILSAMEIPHSIRIRWAPDSPLASIHEQFEEKCRFSFDFAGINGSSEVYALLALIKKFGQFSEQPALSKGYARLTPLLMRIEQEYGNPNVGLVWMAETLQISPQHVNTLFRKLFGLSPYQYLLQFRIEKSKELLLQNRELQIQNVASVVGFHDSSHFVSTFRKCVGMTPVQFRGQYSQFDEQR